VAPARDRLADRLAQQQRGKALDQT
jgi:hypothetical protein